VRDMKYMFVGAVHFNGYCILRTVDRADLVLGR
jgi:hypothetical protein